MDTISRHGATANRQRRTFSSDTRGASPTGADLEQREARHARRLAVARDFDETERDRRRQVRAGLDANLAGGRPDEYDHLPLVPLNTADGSPASAGSGTKRAKGWPDDTAKARNQALLSGSLAPPALAGIPCTYGTASCRVAASDGLEIRWRQGRGSSSLPPGMK